MKEKDTRNLVLKILNEKNKITRNLLYGYYKPRLSKKQIVFIDTRLGRGTTPGIQYAINTLGWKLDKGN